tara:strand:+ start:3565 stop:5547 length:1983 start_codon:yes stop_codon:yes gene_type:complete
MQYKIKLSTKFLLLVVMLKTQLLLGSYNSMGQIGYINTPSAINSRESDLTIILDRSDPDRKFALLASPFDWLDANLFYVDIGGLPYGPNDLYKQSYKDKGFSAKISIPLEKNLIFAFGANDLAGTGFYSSEYLVLTNRIQKFEYSIGLGWGTMNDGISFSNPFIKIDEDFKSRSSLTKDRGGTPDFNNYYSGDKASLFFGGSYMLNNKNKILFELDPTNYSNPNIPYSESKSKFNIAFVRDFNDISLKTSFLRGNKVSLQFAYNKNFLNYGRYSKNVFPSGKINTHEELQKILALNNIGLKSVSNNEDQVIVRVKHNSYQNQYLANRIVKEASSDLSEGFDSIVIIQDYLDMETVEVVYPLKNSVNIRNENYIDSYPAKVDFQVLGKYPSIHTQFTPVIKPFIAGREGFFHAALLVENSTEIVLQENLTLLANFKISLADNFDKLIFPADEPYKNVVRSDIKDYLRNIDNGIGIGRLELNHFKSFKKKHFFRNSIGIYEDMFAGVGIDYLYYPEGSLFSFGAEAYHLRKRDYDWGFGLLDYENTLFRLNAQVVEPKTKINFRLSVGEYLAGDEGYTFEIARRFDNGIEYAAFFTRTDVPTDVYGEGSFDKGIRIKIPFSFFSSNNKTLQEYEWHPLTKDPGAMLVKSIKLRDQIQRSRIY